jgi:hypothetical protein
MAPLMSDACKGQYLLLEAISPMAPLMSDACKGQYLLLDTVAPWPFQHIFVK